jgi:rare lipoprotein A
MNVNKIILLSSALGSFFLAACADLNKKPVTPTAKVEKTDEWNVRSVQHGKASWYSIKTNYGTRTASGERLQNNAYTAAHKTLPMGTKIKVTNLSNGKSEILRITDRGPYIKGRIVDVTIGSAQRLGFYSRGITAVKVEVLDKKTTAEEPKKLAQN